MSDAAPNITPMQVAGMTVNVEHPKGSTRTGIDGDGNPWKSEMKASYGFLPKATGMDSEGLDAYVGDDETAPDVHIVHQNDADGNLEEDKAHLNFSSADAAKKSYLYHMGNKADRFRSITSMPVGTFKSMLTKAEPGSAHWKKKHGREHATTALMARIELSAGGLTITLPADAPKEILELARPRLARCPGCKSHDITRKPSRSADEGPMDKCDHCGHTFPHKPGTIPASMAEMARQNGIGEGAEPEVPGTTEDAGWTDEDPPVLDKDGNPIDEDDEGGLDDDDQEMLERAGIFTSRLANSLTI